jgi:hypothetical protein
MEARHLRKNEVGRAIGLQREHPNIPAALRFIQMRKEHLDVLMILPAGRVGRHLAEVTRTRLDVLGWHAQASFLW